MKGILLLVAFALGAWLLFKIVKFVLIVVVKMIPIWLLLCLFVPEHCGTWAVILLVIGMVVRLLRKRSKSPQTFSSYNCGGSEYVLNKKSGVIHHWLSPSVWDISEKNKRVIPSWKANQLVSRGKRYRYKMEV